MTRPYKRTWQWGGKKTVLENYLKLHEGKVGAHWLWVAIERINKGEAETEVLKDYGYVRDASA